MKIFLPAILGLACMMPSVMKAQSEETTTIRVYENAVFYDGYQMENNPDKELEDGILRHSCSLYSTKLSDEQLDQIGETLKMHIDLGALCDNYDRIGNVNIAFLPKGADSYVPEETERIEIGRFITPFMNKNRQPDVVPYDYDLSYLSPILRDMALREKYDLWLELEIFGVPYAANEQIPGCSDRNDVFKGTLDLITDAEPAALTEGHTLIPIVIKKPEYKGHNLNNYSEEGTDTIGVCTKTYTFEIPEQVSNAKLVLITSNHGANAGGEEYKRRFHYVYLDDAQVLKYKPGRESCEPFRQYNTCPNGIYGSYPQTDKQWQSFSNWCPGDVIDNRIIEIGDMEKGIHKVRIKVPNARFIDKQGDIPVSLYFIADKYDPSGVKLTQAVDNKLMVKVSDGYLIPSSSETILGIDLYKVSGEMLYSAETDEPVSVSGLPKGVYLINVLLSDGNAYTRKVIL